MTDDSSPRRTPGTSALEGLSIDDLIQWLNGQRNAHPETPLDQLLGDQLIDADTLVELAAIDLIGQRRRRRSVSVEDYLSQFPQLAQSNSDTLDLIDAELCVLRELNEDCDVHSLVARFPQLQHEIRQLFFLQPESDRRVPDAGRSETEPSIHAPTDSLLRRPNETLPLDGTDDSYDSSGQFLIQRELSTVGRIVRQPPPKSATPESDDSIDVPIPIAPPAWMVGARCTATAICQGGRYWLIKGRDAEHGESVAMKIIPMPSTIGRLERTRILDLCEICSTVGHPTWIAPRIAAINNGHLAVVRPWVFGNGFGTVARGATHQRLQQLVRLAFALSAAHRVSATHGGVHRHNLIFGHDGTLQLVDVVSSVSAWLEYLAIWKNELTATVHARIALDTIGLVGLMTDESLRQQRPDLVALLGSLSQRVDFDQPDACVQIGEAVQQCLDAPPQPPKKSWLRRRSFGDRDN